MGRILIIRGGAIGDFILTLPVFAALRAQFPGASVEVLGYPHIARLVETGGLVNAVHPIEARALAGFFARGGNLDEAMGAFFAQFALIISYLYDPDGIFRANVCRCTKAQFITGPHRPDDHAGIHATDTFLKTLECLAIFDADSTPRLCLPVSSPRAGRWLAVHPGSGSESKNWPEDRWDQLIRHVAAETNYQILIVGGEAEGDRLERLAAGVPTDRIQVARSLPLDLLADQLRSCSLFVGHDSGITHLAAAVGLPCLVLWGPTNPAIWRPRGERIFLMHDDAGLSGLSLETMWEVLKGSLSRAEPNVPAPTAE